ncbi:type II toxin-antitoxin system VapC family toxin [Deinococcus lacus]|uniref:Type II toxin-antitoxin system VapC family toxin n=1 Tax=Deinococcus lacus TaxID=392561 RepID=A0ABW1YFE8_9DEIO
MTVLYLDSNAIAKIYLTDERDRDTVFNLLDEYATAATCAITYAEVAGLLARALHAERLTEEDYAGAMTSFAQEWELLEVKEVNLQLSQIAAQVMKAQPHLRAMDALHLAAALIVRQSVPLRFVTFDQRLEDAARQLMPEAVK